MKTPNWIKRYAATHKTPDQNYCPIIGIEWNGHNKELGRYYKIYTPYNGKIYVNEVPKELGTDRNRWSRNTLSPRSYPYIGLYVKNIGHNVLEISYVEMDASRGKENEKRQWTYERFRVRMFVDRETLLPYNQDGHRLWEEDDGKFYNKRLVKELYSITSYGRRNPAKLGETLREFCGIDNIRCGWRNELRDLSQMWELSEFIKKAKERPKSKLAINLAAYDLPKRQYEKATIEFYPIDDEYAVFRIFKPEECWDYTERMYIKGKYATERCRVFIKNDGKVTVMEKQIDNDWHIVAKKLSSVVHFYDENVHNIFDSMYDWKPIKWNMDIITSAKANLENGRYYESNGRSGMCIVAYIIRLLRHPIIERLYKMGYRNIALDLITNDEVIATIKSIFYMDKIKENERNIYKMLGVNKYVLQEVNKCLARNNYNKVRINDIKEIFGTFDISSLSKETLDMYINGLNHCGYRGWRPLVGDHRYYYWVREKLTNTPTEEQRKLLEKLFRIEQKEPGIIEAYSDAQGIFNRLHVKPEINWNDFRHLEDVTIIHDNLQALMNVQEEEYRRNRAEMDKKAAEEREKQFKKLQEDRLKKFECIGEKYSILIPKNLSEITTEGSSLHHCVGGYLNNHADGRTNILFLRNNELPNTPFYTIEVTPDDYVQQIHGKNNCWLGNDPNAISFVWKWIMDRGFRCEKYKLLNTGVGYSRGKNEVSETYLTA